MKQIGIEGANKWWKTQRKTKTKENKNEGKQESKTRARTVSEMEKKATLHTEEGKINTRRKEDERKMKVTLRKVKQIRVLCMQFQLGNLMFKKLIL